MRAIVSAMLLIICFGVHAETNSIPAPPSLSAPTSTNFTGVISDEPSAVPVFTPAKYEWELTYVWQPSLTSTNRVVLPIRTIVEFEHNKGFIFVEARKRKR